MNSFSHLSGSGKRGRGRGTPGASNNQEQNGKRGRGRATNGASGKQRSQQHLAVPGRGVQHKPKVSTLVPTPTWGPQKDTGSKRELPQYTVPAAVEYVSSDEEDEVDDQVLNKMLSGYEEDKENIKSQLVDLYSMNSNSCLVCISTVRHAEAVWSCPTCSCSFHLVCIQKWARDGIKAPSVLSDELFPDKDIPWHCPKCRHEFSKKQIPTRYYCYCGRKEDPDYDPWIAPHSCGEVCGKQLTPNCGHSCLLLCHPGRCPPCPKQIRTSCFCGAQTNVTRRCGQARWSCGTKCGKPLQCGQHSCDQLCHESECRVCEKQSVQHCRCGKESELRQCLQFDWQCARVCGKKLPCGKHVCMEICHEGGCKPCPESLRSTCPCGKTPLPPAYPCDLDLPVCESSCDKPLPCGQHNCFKLCHLGTCDVCFQVSDKSCRCGRTHKVVPCLQELTCEGKCNRSKDCGRHACKRKCCPGDCLPCEKQCGKTLPCRNHKCVSDCHGGRCYPCPEKVTVPCKCGVTRITVACGRERNTRPPKCKSSCKEASLCHHPTPVTHRCHTGTCPPCKQVCGEQLTKCEHECPAPCHDRVLVQGKGAWDPVVQQIQKLPCPPCSVLEHISCYGEHEVTTVKCSEMRPFSCGRACGKTLPCGNHTCHRECHYLTEECSVCDEMCTRGRKCAHPCTRACHEDPCPPCRQYVRVPCHCSILHLSVKCIEFTGGDSGKLSTLLSCGSPCSKLLPCTHTCRKICHLGPCSSQRECKRKVTLHCACRRQKAEYKCGEVFGKETEKTPRCDKLCKEALLKSRDKAVEEEEEEEQDDTDNNNQGRRRKRRKDRVVEQEPSFLRRHLPKLGTFAALLVALAGIYFCTLDV